MALAVLRAYCVHDDVLERYIGSIDHRQTALHLELANILTVLSTVVATYPIFLEDPQHCSCELASIFKVTSNCFFLRN